MTPVNNSRLWFVSLVCKSNWLFCQMSLMPVSNLVTTTRLENFLPVRLSWAAWQSEWLANSMNTFPQPGETRDLARGGIRPEVYFTWHLHSRHRAGNLDGLHLAELSALLADVFQNILVLLLQVQGQTSYATITGAK